MLPSCHPAAAPGGISADLPLLVVTGLIVSLGHCLGMCGPLQAAFAVGARSRGRLLPALLRYHLARIGGYVLLGAAAGLVGSAVRWGSSTVVIQGVLALAAGGVMIPVGLGLLGIVTAPRALEFPGISRRITGAIVGGATRPVAARDALLGVANGFLPCGAVGAVALTAMASAHPAVGALLLAAFGVGTLPVLVGAGVAVVHLGSRARLRFHRIGGAMVLLLAAQLVLRGLAVMEIVPHWRSGPFVFW